MQITNHRWNCKAMAELNNGDRRAPWKHHVTNFIENNTCKIAIECADPRCPGKVEMAAEDFLLEFIPNGEINY